MKACIRRATRADLDGLVALEAGFPGDRLSRASLRRLLGRPSARIWVADVPDQPVSGALVLLLRRGSRAARVYSLAVDPRHRNRGIARALVAHAEASAASIGCDRIRLEVRADNDAAADLYGALGYRVVETLPGYYDDGSDGLRLMKRLGHEDTGVPDGDTSAATGVPRPQR